MKAKKILAGVFAVLMLLPFLAINAKIAHAQSDTVQDTVTTQVPDNYTKIENLLGNENLSLYVKTDENGNMLPAFIVVDKRNGGRVWSSEVLQNEFPFTKLSSENQVQLTSLMGITWYRKDNNNAQITPLYSSDPGCRHNIQLIPNGIRFNIEFIDKNSIISGGPNIEVTMDVLLKDDILTVSIPADRIVEKNNGRLIDIHVLPYFGYANDYNNGYAVIPDGSGALYHFSPVRKTTPKIITLSVYGSREVNLLTENLSPFYYRQTGVAAPVWGVKRDNHAMAALITKGDHEAQIQFKPSGISSINVTNINPIFNYRYVARRDKSGKNFYADNLDQIDREIQYFFMAEEDADNPPNYSGMAKRIREYMLDKDILVSRLTEDDDTIPLNMDVFMGTTQRQIIFEEFLVTTTFDQVRNIMADLKENGIDKLMLNLEGWNYRGALSQPAHFPVAGILGGEGAFKEMIAYAKTLNYELGLVDDFVVAYESNSDYFNKRIDVVYRRTGFMAMPGTWGAYFLNPQRAYEYFYRQQYHPRAEDYGISGTYFQMMGVRVYPDFRPSDVPGSPHINYIMRDATIAYYRNMLKESREALGFAAVEGANAYIWSETTFINKIAMEHSGYYVYDESIPFLQMLIHGALPYSSASGNLTADYDKLFLQWMEYGCVPYFKITHERTESLRNTDFKLLFSTRYEDYAERIAQAYHEMNAVMGDTYNQPIISHSTLDAEGNVKRVEYQNGVVVYVNYGDEAYALDAELTIQPKDYLVTEGGVKRVYTK